MELRKEVITMEKLKFCPNCGTANSQEEGRVECDECQVELFWCSDCEEYSLTEECDCCEDAE